MENTLEFPTSCVLEEGVNMGREVMLEAVRSPDPWTREVMNWNRIAARVIRRVGGV